MKHILGLLTLSLVAFTAACVSTPDPETEFGEGAPSPDKEALIALYNATGGDSWDRNENWLSGAPVGEWEGVTANVEGRVTELDLRDNDMSGEPRSWAVSQT